MTSLLLSSVLIRVFFQESIIGIHAKWKLTYKRVLQVGCGTAISISCLHNTYTLLHLQHYIMYTATLHHYIIIVSSLHHVHSYIASSLHHYIAILQHHYIIITSSLHNYIASLHHHYTLHYIIITSSSLHHHHYTATLHHHLTCSAGCSQLVENMIQRWWCSRVCEWLHCSQGHDVMTLQYT